jgi:hypothetical protein
MSRINESKTDAETTGNMDALDTRQRSFSAIITDVVEVGSTMRTDKITVIGDRRAKEYCVEIAKEMVRLFEIPLSEAIGRINREFKNERIFGPDQFYRRDPAEWAKTIYYEVGTWWWVEKWMAEHTPKPKPYP